MAWLDKSVGKTVANFDEWHKDLKALAELAKDKNYDEVLKKGEEVRRLYPDYVYDGERLRISGRGVSGQGRQAGGRGGADRLRKAGRAQPGAR